jgi:molecular chaperone GrpE (heat shock protein)
MYSINSFIDVIQNIKKTTTKQLVSDETLQNMIIGMIDAQTTVAKTVSDDLIKNIKQFNDNVCSAVKSVNKTA